MALRSLALGYHSAPMPKRHGFTFESAELHDMAEQVLAHAKRAGASGCDCEVSEAYGLTVTVRKGKIVYREYFWDHTEALATLGLSE